MSDREPRNAYRIPEAAIGTNYPAPFAPLVSGRSKRRIGDAFGLENFGINLTTLQPESRSALHHAHSKQDEFVFVLEGELTLHFGDDEHVLGAGDCMGFRAGTGLAHHFVNRSAAPATYLEIGDRSAGDEVEYPHDDIAAVLGDDGRWRFSHKDGTPY